MDKEKIILELRKLQSQCLDRMMRSEGSSLEALRDMYKACGEFDGLQMAIDMLKRN